VVLVLASSILKVFVGVAKFGTAKKCACPQYQNMKPPQKQKTQSILLSMVFRAVATPLLNWIKNDLWSLFTIGGKSINLIGGLNKVVSKVTRHGKRVVIEWLHQTAQGRVFHP